MRWVLYSFFIVMAATRLAVAAEEVEMLKSEIFLMAESFQGQGDQDGSKQKQLEVLVEELLKAQPQAPVAERLSLLYGPWKQVWGPYEYRKNDRSVDPTIDPQNIYQVVFEGGYYYNVNPTLKKSGEVKNTALLRGEFALVPGTRDSLKVQFTDLRHIKGLPQDGLRLQDLPALSEARQLPGERTTLPGFLVRLLFGGGYLEEVYTDHDMRILFGSGRENGVQDYIYIMKRAD